MTTAQIIVTVCFVFVMICNVITSVRHWRMMRVMNIMLTGLAETQKQFNDIMEAEQRERRGKINSGLATPTDTRFS